MGTSWLLASYMEAGGKQDLWIKQKPEVLPVLREQAIIQSAESSNRIEGGTVSPERLRPVVIGRAKPRDRSEEELAGYRRALDWIFSRKRIVPVTPKVVRKLHALAQGGATGDAGEWKKRDNEIIEILPTGEPRVRFVPEMRPVLADLQGAMGRAPSLRLSNWPRRRILACVYFPRSSQEFPQGKSEAAEDSLRPAIASHPNWFQPHGMLARQWLFRSRLDEAALAAEVERTLREIRPR